MRVASASRWQDWTSFGLGLWLATSPWILGHAESDAATANAAVVGLALALASHLEVSLDEDSVEWFNMVAGLWLVLAPFVLGFGGEAAATINSIATGTLVAALASSALSLDRQIEKWWHRRQAS